MSANLYTRFQAAFPSHPTTPFLVSPHWSTRTYGELDTVSARYAQLLQRLGVGRGDRVAVQVEKSPEALYLYLACLRAGAIFLPLNTAYTQHELDYLIDNAQPSLVVCRPGDQAELGALCGRSGVANLLTLGAHGEGTLCSGARDLPGVFETLEVSHHDPAAMLYTSGTTGRPKGALLSHRNLIGLAETLGEIWAFSHEDVLLHALPIFHGHGLFVSTNVILTVGGTLLFLPKFDAAEVCGLLPRASVMMGVPTFYTRLLGQAELNADRCRHIRLFTSGSAPLLQETFRQFEQRTGHRVLERYGTTEAGIATSNPLHGERRPGTIGRPLPGLAVRTLDEQGNIAPIGEPGLLQVKGPCVFAGYWRLPDKTRAAFTQDGFFKTGDFAVADADGYINLMGRESDLVISGGYNVYPREVEAVMDGLDGVAQSAVVGVPHPDFGEAVIACVRPSAEASLVEEELRTLLRAELAGYKVPKRVLFVDEFPRNALGKIVKAQLRERFSGLFAS